MENITSVHGLRGSMSKILRACGSMRAKKRNKYDLFQLQGLMVRVETHPSRARKLIAAMAEITPTHDRRELSRFLKNAVRGLKAMKAMRAAMKGIQKMLRRRCVADFGNHHEKLIVISECQMVSNLHRQKRLEDSSPSE